jgi:hypothetical protein
MSDAPIVERVARAIAKQIASSAGVATHGDTWRDWIPEARASILAMREPTEAMREAGAQYAECGISANAVFGYRAMIDEALKEQP